MEGRGGNRRDLAAVLRRLATDAAFEAAVLSDPAAELAPYDLSADDLSALALLLERPASGPGIEGLFREGSRPPGQS